MKRLLLSLAFLALPVRPALAEVVWYPLPDVAYAFGQKYPEAQRILYAFDYGHALIYERLLADRGRIPDPATLEQDLLAQILAILRNPPSVKPAEEDIAPLYTYTFPLVIDLFDWSHDLHQFVYDILVTSPDRGPGMVAKVDAVFRKYQSNSSIAITNQCKTMLFMDGQYFSKAFRRTYPSLNLLIWSYHWFQMRLYEALMKPSESLRDQAVAETVQKFWSLVSNLPDSADFDMMPATPEVAPAFVAAFPDLWPAFDNLHMLHDILSDMIVSSKVKDDALVSEGIRYGRMDQDPNAFKSQNCQY